MRATTIIDFADDDDISLDGMVDQVEMTRTVGDLDPYDWMWYLLSISELAGFDVKDIKIVMKDGKLLETDW